MKATMEQLETQLAELAKRLGSARFWADRETHKGWDSDGYWRAEERRLEAEFAKVNERLQRKKRKGNA